ncbi:MAG: ATP-binding protein, partial [Actinomycetota bacterium]|nr:ATP-binding protein [Actinomycetota bacterium]
MTLVERGAALGALTAGFAECVSGASRVVVVTGGLASGKSRLLSVFGDHVVDSGARLLGATGSRGERSLLLSTIGQLASGLGDEDIDFVDGVIALARVCPVVLAVDDVQYVDEASKRVLAGLRARIADLPVMIVLTGWSPLATDDLTRDPDRVVRIGPLTRDGVASLAIDRLGAGAEALAPTLHSLSGGNPMLAHALVSDYRPGDEPVVGIAFRQAVLGCLHRWEPKLLDVAKAVAVLRGQVRPELVARLAATDVKTVERMTAVLADAGLMADGDYATEAVRDIVLDSLSRDEGVRLNLCAAEQLHARGAKPTVVARHLVTADAVNGGWAVDVLRGAAEHAPAGFAVQCLELALRAAPSSAAVVGDLARARWRVTPTCRWPLTDLDPVTGARYALWAANPDLTESVLTAARVADPDAAADLCLADAWIRGRRSIERFASSNLWDRSASALIPGLLRGDLLEVTRDAQRVLNCCPLTDTTVEVLASALVAMLWADQPAQAAICCDDLIAQAVRRGATTWVAVFSAVRADIALRQGDIRGARARAADALALLPTQSWGAVIGLPLAIMLTADNRAGDYAAGAEVLRQVVPDTLWDTAFGLRYLRARGHHYLATGRLLAAIADFQACARAMRRWEADLPALVPWRTDLAEVHLRLGRRRLAGRLAHQQLD